jgi:hypothetical protein
MTNNVQGRVRFIVMDAPGYYGTYAEIYSSHATLDAAIRKCGRSKSRMVSTDGGWNATHGAGNRVHREFASRYERLS